MANRMDVHSINARNIRVHIRKALTEMQTTGETSYEQLRRWLDLEKVKEWAAAGKRIEKIRLQQQDAKFLAEELGFTHLHPLVLRGSNLRSRYLRLASEEAKIQTFKSTDASRIRVFRKKVRLIAASYAKEADAIRAQIALLTDEHWEYLDRDDEFDWLIKWKKDDDIAHIPFEILQAEKIQLLERWISEWDEKIETYESLPNPSTK